MKNQLAKELYIELIYLIAKGFVGISPLERLEGNKKWKPPVRGEKGLINYHLHSRAFEKCASVLSEIGVVQMVSCQNGIVQSNADACCLWHMNLSQVRCFVREMLDKEASASKRPLNKLLIAFLDIAVEYGIDNESLPANRRYFKPSKQYLKILHLCVQCGYANSQNSEFCWTDQIGMAMQINDFWNENNECFRD